MRLIKIAVCKSPLIIIIVCTTVQAILVCNDLSGGFQRNDKRNRDISHIYFFCFKNEKYLITEEEGALSLNVEQKEKQKLYLLKILPTGHLFPGWSLRCYFRYNKSDVLCKGKRGITYTKPVRKYYTSLLKQIWGKRECLPLPEIENLKIPPPIEL